MYPCIQYSAVRGESILFRADHSVSEDSLSPPLVTQFSHPTVFRELCPFVPTCCGIVRQSLLWKNVPEIDEGGFMKTGMKEGRKAETFHFLGFLRGFRFRIVFVVVVVVVHRCTSVICGARLCE